MKKLLAALLCVLVATAMMPAVAFASVATQVNIGADILVDGEPKNYGQGKIGRAHV